MDFGAIGVEPFGLGCNLLRFSGASRVLERRGQVVPGVCIGGCERHCLAIKRQRSIDHPRLFVRASERGAKDRIRRIFPNELLERSDRIHALRFFVTAKQRRHVARIAIRRPPVRTRGDVAEACEFGSGFRVDAGRTRRDGGALDFLQSR